MKNNIRKILTSLILAVFLSGAAFSLTACAARIKIPDEHYSEADSSLINPEADECAVELMSYLKSIYGKYVLSGQYINEYEDFEAAEFRADPSDPLSPATVFKANELQAVRKVTGQYPAVLGLDVSGIECGERCYSIEQAIEWHDAGGIVTICWHWKIDNLDGNPRAFYEWDTDFDLKETLKDKNGAKYASLTADIDAVAEAMKPLREAGVPVLWRPLHEASGGWFWWGAAGADAYKELWDIIYYRMTAIHGLNNLIWVYNGQNRKWYVGDDKCDIVSDDPYYEENSREAYLEDTANALRFKETYRASDKKMIWMSENDFIFDIEAAFEENTRWLGFCTWCREFVCVYLEGEDGVYRTYPEYGAMCNTPEELKAIYSDARVLTLSDLPRCDTELIQVIALFCKAW